MGSWASVYTNDPSLRGGRRKEGKGGGGGGEGLHTLPSKISRDIDKISKHFAFGD